MSNEIISYSPKEIAAFKGLFALAKDGRQFSDIKVQDIATAAGIGKGTLYEYFSSKEDIMSSAILFALDGVLDRLERSTDESMTFRQLLEHFLDEMNRDLPLAALSGLVTSISFEQCTAIKERNKEALVRLISRIRQVEARAFAVGRKSGEISQELSDHFCEYVVMSAFFGRAASHILSYQYGQCEMSSDMLAEMICRTLRP